MPSYFLTVTPDDENSFLVQMYSQVTVDDNRPIATLSDSDLIVRAKQRTQLRIQYPGICAYFFEAVLDIVIEEVIGWDLQKERPRDDIVGLFGVPEAFTVSTEEQGRKTLHSHIQIWVRDFSQWREDLHSLNRLVWRAAEKRITEAMDRVGSCCLFFDQDEGYRTNPRRAAVAAFPHECTVAKRERCSPAVVDDQKLRNLCHKEGLTASGGILAYCPNCTKSWTGEELVESCLLNKVKVPGFTRYPDIETTEIYGSRISERCSKWLSSELHC